MFADEVHKTYQIYIKYFTTSNAKNINKERVQFFELLFCFPFPNECFQAKEILLLIIVIVNIFDFQFVSFTLPVIFFTFFFALFWSALFELPSAKIEMIFLGGARGRKMEGPGNENDAKQSEKINGFHDNNMLQVNNHNILF